MKRYLCSFALVWGLMYSIHASANILPPNRLYLYDNVKDEGNVTEAQFHQIVNDVVEFWKPLAAIHGAKLEGSADWKDSTVNAYATQTGSTWSVHMFGGLARRKEITPDGFAMVVCHELGHHFGGYAFYGDYDWAAAEGQSDYWATQVCARHIWKSRNSPANAQLNRFYYYKARPVVQEHCRKAWSNPEDIALCNRATEAGLSLATLLAVVGGEWKMPNINTPDTSEVNSTMTSHPDAQCRLDTYIAGAVCKQEFDLKVIPGRKHSKGQESAEAEAEAAKYSCMSSMGFTEGVRPRCWFKPLVKKLIWPNRPY